MIKHIYYDDFIAYFREYLGDLDDYLCEAGYAALYDYLEKEYPSRSLDVSYIIQSYYQRYKTDTPMHEDEQIIAQIGSDLYLISLEETDSPHN